jgi:hypothetical protein
VPRKQRRPAVTAGGTFSVMPKTAADYQGVLLQAAVYCGVPDANAAFRVAQRVLDES